MSEYGQTLCESMQIIAQAEVAKMKFDRTIKATIERVVNVNEGVYEVRYEGNIVRAYSQDLKKSFRVDEEVFVKIPEGDPSNKKIITGKVNETSLSYSQLNQLSNSVIEISPTFDNSSLYNYDKTGPWKVCAGKGDTDFVMGSFGATYQRGSAHDLFQQYSSQYEYIRIKGSFMTQFHMDHTDGNYGLEVGFFTEDGDVSYRLDFESFNGDPYNFIVYSPQWTVIKVQKNYLQGLKYIRLFQEDFLYDVKTDYVFNDTTKDYDRVDTTIRTENIFVKDVEISYVDVQDLTREPYYAYIAAPKGKIFSANTSSIDLEARLLSYGEPVNYDKCVFEWYQRDLSVMVGSEDYQKNAGFGWKKLDGQNGNILKLTRNDDIYQARYKCVMVYNEEVVMSAEAEVLNSVSSYKYHIDQTTDGDVLTLTLTNDISGGRPLYGNWYLSYPDNSYSPVQNGQNKNAIDVQEYLVYTAVIFYCAVLSADRTKVIGTIEHTIMNTESDADVLISYTGEDTFRYDANGDTAFTDTEKERVLAIHLAWKPGFGSSYTVDWIGPDGLPIPLASSKPTVDEYRYNPANSMMENIWIDNSKILHYNIKQKFKTTYNNNTFTIKITTIDKKVYIFKKEILFIKDGDQGTNGTSYIAAVRPCNLNNEKLSGFNGLRYSNGWQNTLRLGCFVYKDGEQINPTGGNSNYTIFYKWEYTNVGAPTDDTAQVVVSGRGGITGNSADVQRYVSVKVTINDKINGKTIQIYALYPIDVLVGTALDIKKIDISDIPLYVKYTASGTSPVFYSNPLRWSYNNVEYPIQYFKTEAESVIKLETRDDGKLYLQPPANFIFDNNAIGVIKCVRTASSYIIHPIILYLDTYGNEAINGWDGTKLAIDEANGQYIFAPQVGAGEKDSTNRFTGVVMGKDSGRSKIGLYGYNSGITTFGLMQDGTAYLGSPSSGQLLFNWDSTNKKSSGTIQSLAYKNNNTEGMMINLETGHIDAYNFLISSKNMVLSSANQSFEFKLGSNSNSKFRIYFPRGTTVGGSTLAADKNVFFIGNADSDGTAAYYLQSLDYQAKTSSVDGKGTKIDLKSGSITSYNFRIATPKMTLTSDESNGSFDFDVSNSGKFDIYTKSGNTKKYLLYIHGADSNNQYYLASNDFSPGTSTSNGTGTKINLATGKIISYSFHLDTPYLTIKSSNGGTSDQAVDSDSKGFFDFNTQNGGTFKVRWNNKNLIYVLGSTNPSGDSEDSSSFYLQSYDYSDSAGMKINLSTGKITAHVFQLKTNYLTIGSTNTGTFNLDVSGKGVFKITDGTGSSGKTLFCIQGVDSLATGTDANASSDGDVKIGTKDGGQFYLQSYNYNTGSKLGTRIDLASGRITSYNFTIKSSYITISSDGKGYFDIDLIGGGHFQIKDTTSGNTQTTLFNISGDTYYLQSKNYSNTNSSETTDNNPTSGMRINLSNGRIWATNVTLSGKITTESGSIGGWSIKNNGISNASNTIYFRSNGTGDISDTDGSIADGMIETSSGWTSNSTTASASMRVGKFYVSSTGAIKSGTDFRVSSSGKLWCTGAYINGEVVATKGDVLAAIADEGITSGKIAASAITAVKIAASAVTADKINSSAVTADKISANAVTTDKIEASAVTADKISANAVTTDKINANAVTANKMKLQGEMTVYQSSSSDISGGSLGYCSGLVGGTNGGATDGIAIKASSGGAHCIATTGGARISSGSGHSIYVDSTGGRCNCGFQVDGKMTLNGTGNNQYIAGLKIDISNVVGTINAKFK